MTQETAAQLVEENLTAIYGYAYTRLYDKSKVEDLSSEIILEILNSAENLRHEGAFWGFAWSIAENTLHKFLRREQLLRQCLSLEGEHLTDVLVSFDRSDIAEEDELLYRLRRELSLLSSRYRKICVSYYVENKSCSAIAMEQHISVETVKQHLFKARKLLKEGMEMERKLGEKSYNPGTFRLGFWGDWNHYGNLFDKKLPGAILLTAYNSPITAEELSVELGVAMPYLEEEIETLETAGLLVKRGKKYETGIIIITDEYEKAFEQQTKDIYPELANIVYTSVREKLPDIRRLNFHGNDYDDNRLMFGILNIVFVRGFEWSNYISPPGQPPKLALGGNGWLCGYDNDYVNLHFRGVTIRTPNKAETAWFSAENYQVLLPVRHYDHRQFEARTEVMCDAILGNIPDRNNPTLPDLIENGFVSVRDGWLQPNFLTFENGVFEDLLALLKPVYEAVADCMIEISAKAEEILGKTVPAWLKPQCLDIAKILHRLDVSACLLESMIASGLLTVPEEKTPLCVFGVKF